MRASRGRRLTMLKPGACAVHGRSGRRIRTVTARLGICPAARERLRWSSKV
jgi:hypothetical protein